MENFGNSLQDRVVLLLSLAVRDSGLPIAQIARKAGLKWDTVSRTISGQRAATFPEIVAILEAAGLPGEQSLRLMLSVELDFVVAQGRSEAAAFMSDLVKQVPREIILQLGDNLGDLRPRWAQGTAMMLAQTLSRHVCELNRRGDAICANVSVSNAR